MTELKEAKIYEDGIPKTMEYSDLEKQLGRKYPNFTNITWQMVRNVNLVMKFMLGIFIVQAVGLLLFILSQVM